RRLLAHSRPEGTSVAPDHQDRGGPTVLVSTFCGWLIASLVFGLLGGLLVGSFGREQGDMPIDIGEWTVGRFAFLYGGVCFGGCSGMGGGLLGFLLGKILVRGRRTR